MDSPLSLEPRASEKRRREEKKHNTQLLCAFRLTCLCVFIFHRKTPSFQFKCTTSIDYHIDLVSPAAQAANVSMLMLVSCLLMGDI